VLITLIWFLQLAADPPWEINQTAIFEPLDQNSFAVSDAFHFYLMDRKGHRIRIYNSAGRFVKSIGGHGNGPGEFRFLFGIRFEDHLLYGLDPMASKLSVFDEDGEFIASHKAPREMLVSFPYSAKVVNGWVYSLRAKKQIIWVDEAFENPTVLAEIPQTDKPQDIIEVTSDMPVFAASPDSKTLYIYPGKGKFEIQVYDIPSKKFKTITKDIPNLPYDMEFGKKRFEQYHSRQRDHFKPQFPDFFPAIEYMTTDPDGLLIVYQGRHILNKDTPAMVMDENGHTAVSRFPTRHLSRILAVDGEYVFVSIYLDEEMGVRRIPIQELGPFFHEE